MNNNSVCGKIGILIFFITDMEKVEDLTIGKYVVFFRQVKLYLKLIGQINKLSPRKCTI